MKRLIISTIAICFCLVSMANRNNDGETRSATVRLDVSSTDVINIQAKYTDLTVEAWDRNEVMIEASVVFDGKMNKRVQEFLDNFEQEVKENISKKGNEILIETNLDEPNKVQIGSKNVGIIFSFSEDELRIEYKIKSPPSNKYIINSSYRDAFLYGHFKDVDLTQYSGDLEAEFIDKAKLNLKYGSATFKELGEVDMEIYEQNIESGKINTLKLNAKYSDLEITEVESLDAISYESDYTIGSIASLTGNFKYGEMEVTQEIKRAKLTLYEEDIEARKIGNLTLENSKYSKIIVARIESIALKASYEDQFTIGSLGSLTSTDSKYGKYQIDQLQSKFQLDGYEDNIEIDDISSSATIVAIDGKYIKASIGANDIPFVLNSKIKYGQINYDEGIVDVRKYIKDSDLLELEAYSKKKSEKRLQIHVNGYEIDLNIE